MDCRYCAPYDCDCCDYCDTTIDNCTICEICVEHECVCNLCTAAADEWCTCGQVGCPSVDHCHTCQHHHYQCIC